MQFFEVELRTVAYATVRVLADDKEHAKQAALSDCRSYNVEWEADRNADVQVTEVILDTIQTE